MDIKTLLSKVNTGVKVASAVLDAKKPLDPAIALSFLLDRRFSSAEDYFDSTESLCYLNERDFPSLQKREIVEFPNGRTTLTGYLSKPKRPLGLVIAAHGIFSLSDSYGAIFQDHFLAKGFAVLAIDLSCSGASGGLSIPGLHQSAFDVAAAEAYAHSRRDLKDLPICLFGHSWGGYGVCASLSLDPSPVAIASLSGFKDPYSVMLSLPRNYVGPIVDLTAEDLKEGLLKRSGEVAFLSGEKALQSHSATEVLLVHGENDKTVNPKTAGLISGSYGKNVHKALLPNKEHGDVFFSYRAIEAYQAFEPKKKAFEKEYGKRLSKIDGEALNAYRASFSKEANSELDEDLFRQIDELFCSCCGKARR